MMNRGTGYRLGIGGALLAAGTLTAWSLGQGDVPVEPAPMEVIMAEAEVAAVSWDLPVTRNESVDTWIDFLNGRNYEKTRVWLERAGRYGGLIRGELRARGMPEDLLYLAMIESGLSPKAYSVAAASGMWQFITETGRRYGLEVSSEVDERRDPIAATTAALDYLEKLHNQFGSWYLAAAAYNSGENRVARILRERAGGARGADSLFWTIAPHLPRETRNYVPLMLAAGHIAKEPEAFGFADLEYQDELAFEEVWVPGATELSLVAEAATVPLEALRDLNPHLVRERTPKDRAWAVRIPVGSSVAFAERFPQLFREVRFARVQPSEEAASAARTYRVTRGETLSHIAVRHGVSVAALRAANGNIAPTRLRAGQTLRIPGASTMAVESAPLYHRVRSGENLTVIARRYNVSIRQLRSWNDLGSTSRILAGQRLRVNS